MAVQGGHTAMAALLLEAGADPLLEEFVDAGLSRSLLHVAAGCHRDEEAMLPLLVKVGYDPREADGQGNTCLHLAAAAGNLNICRAAVKQGRCAVNACNGKKQTALHLAASSGSVDVAEFLIDSRADKDLTDMDGLTAAQLAVRAGLDDMVEYLLTGHRSRPATGSTAASKQSG